MKPFDFAAFHGGIEKWPKLSHEEHDAYWKWKAEAAAQESLALYLHGLPGLIARDQVWDLVSPYLTKDVLARFLVLAKWTPTAHVTIRQALVVTLDLFYRYAEQRQTISAAKLADTLAVRWSPRYRMVGAETGCHHIPNMTREDARCILRELQCEGIAFWDFWYLAVGGSSVITRPIPLYTRGRLVARRGYRITPKRKGIVAEFLTIVIKDTGYRRPRGPKAVGLHLADRTLPRAPARREFAGGQPYNVVVSGPAAQDRLRQLEGVVLWFDVVNFAYDYITYRHVLRDMKRSTSDSKERRRIAGMQTQITAARRQVHALDKGTLLDGRYVPIRVGYKRTINRRFHARHFGPEWVSAQDLPDGLGSPRERWFRFPRPWGTTAPAGVEWDTEQLRASYPLRGYDTSSSMTQIITWLCGIEELEPLVFNQEKSFTTYLVELFWKNRARLLLRETYTDPADIRDMVKSLWTAHTYGGAINRAVAADGRWITNPTAQPPRRPPSGAPKGEMVLYHKLRAAFHKKHIRPVADAVRAFLEEQLWYPPLKAFREAMRCLAAEALSQSNGFRGVALADPYDGAAIHWNTVEISAFRLQGDGGDLTLRLPGKWGVSRLEVDPHTLKPKREFKDAAKDPHGDGYRIDSKTLMRELPPFMIHMLDAMLSALVMEQFVPRTIKRVTLAEQAAQYPPRHVGPADGWQVAPDVPTALVALHDAWYVPGVGVGEGRPLGEFSVEAPIRVAVQAAAREWDKRLAPIYDFMVDGLKGTEFEGWALKIRERWRTRSDTPRFVISPAPKPI